MTAIAIILTVLIFIALLRVGVIFKYSAAGPELWLKIGFLRLRLKTDRPAEKKRKTKIDLEGIKPGSFAEFKELLGAIKKILARIKRKLLIKRLELHYTSAGEDAAITALSFGAANAVFSVIIPLLEKHFRIKKRDLGASADFTANQPKIYAKIIISIAVWESIYIAAAILPVFKAGAAARTDGKGGTANGKRTDKQHAGDNNAEN